VFVVYNGLGKGYAGLKKKRERTTNKEQYILLRLEPMKRRSQRQQGVREGESED
jgi:hypothetical protein